MTHLHFSKAMVPGCNGKCDILEFHYVCLLTNNMNDLGSHVQRHTLAVPTHFVACSTRWDFPEDKDEAIFGQGCFSLRMSCVYHKGKTCLDGSQYGIHRKAFI